MATAVATSVTLQRRLFTVAEYARMLTAGILSEDDRVELIDGAVRVMSPIGPLHAAIVDRLNRIIVLLCTNSTIVRVQSAIQLNDYTEPQPDIARAMALAETHALRGYDAVQCAVAVEIHRARLVRGMPVLTLVSAAAALNTAAAAEGLLVEDPNAYP